MDAQASCVGHAALSPSDPNLLARGKPGWWGDRSRRVWCDTTVVRCAKSFGTTSRSAGLHDPGRRCAASQAACSRGPGGTAGLRRQSSRAEATWTQPHAGGVARPPPNSRARAACSDPVGLINVASRALSVVNRRNMGRRGTTISSTAVDESHLVRLGRRDRDHYRLVGRDQFTELLATRIWRRPS
jgi:hypothetical protein